MDNIFYWIALLALLSVSVVFFIKNNKDKYNASIKVLLAFINSYKKEIIGNAETYLIKLTDTLSATSLEEFQSYVIENIVKESKELILDKLDKYADDDVMDIISHYLKTSDVEDVITDILIKYLNNTGFFSKLEDKYDILVKQLDKAEDKLDDLSK